MFNPRRLRMLEASLVLLFLLHAWRALIPSVFGILYDNGFEEQASMWATMWAFISVILAMLTAAAPMLAPRRFPRLTLALAALAVAIARPVLNADSLMARYWGGLAVLAAGGIYMATLIRIRPRTLVIGLTAALVADQLLRALGQTYDPGLYPWLLLPFSLLALMLVIISGVLFAAHPNELTVHVESGRLSLVGGLALGAAIFIETSLLALPNAVARWSNWDYAIIAPVFIAATCLPLFLHVRRRAGRILARRRWIGAALIAATLAGLAVGHLQMGVLSALGLLVAHVAILTAIFQVAEPAHARQSDRTGIGLTWGLGLAGVLAIAFLLAYNYAYTLPAMKNMGLPLYLLAGLLASQAAVTCKGSEPPTHISAEYYRSTGGLIGVGLVTLAVIAASLPLPVHRNNSPGPFTVVTHTIRYGFDNRWHYRLDELAAAIEQTNADIVLLQEIDTGRLRSYSADEVLYLARRLRMDAVYMPTIEHLTGIAILHRLPEVSSTPHLLDSEKEQTGVVQVHLQPGGRNVYVYSTWLGVRGENTDKQVGQLVDFIGTNWPAVLGGSFFAEPGTLVYSVVADNGFDYVALGIGQATPDPKAEQTEPHIDYIWTRGLTPLRGWTPAGPAMNHVMVAVQFELP